MLNLITEIVILLTALLGLYKVAKYNKPVTRRRPKDNEEPESGSKRFSYFAPFLSMASVYAAILVPLLFLLGFMWIVRIGRDVMHDPSRQPTATSVATPAVDTQQGPHYWAWQAARAVWEQSGQDSLLVQVIESAIAGKEYDVALAAAQESRRGHTRDNHLAKIGLAAAASGAGALAVEAAAAIGSTSERDRVTRGVVQLLLESRRQQADQNDSVARQQAPPN